MKTTVARDANTWHTVAARAANTQDVTERAMEHRWGWRRPCRARVSVSTGAGASGLGQLKNLSMSGAFLETTVPLPLYAQLTIVVLRKDGGTHRLEFAGVVVRREANGVGIEWSEPYPGSICGALDCDIDCAYAKGVPA